jgi:hypothetical protein
MVVAHGIHLGKNDPLLRTSKKNDHWLRASKKNSGRIEEPKG